MPSSPEPIREALLKHLREVHLRAMSPKSAGVGMRALAEALKPLGFTQHQLADQLDYLVQQGWVREVVEYRPFTGAGGVARTSERRSYKISAEGIDFLDAGLPPGRSSGVPPVQPRFAELAGVLDDLRGALLDLPHLGEERRREIVGDLDSLRGQLEKPHPTPSVVRTLWEGIERAVRIPALDSLLHRVGALLAPLLA